MRLSRLPGTIEPLVSLEEAYQQLRLDPDFGTSPPSRSDDQHILQCIAAATDEIDGVNGFLGRALVLQSWTMTLEAFPSGEIVVPLPPLISVDTVVYRDGTGEEQSLTEGSDFYLVPSSDTDPAALRPLSGGWPSALAGTVAVTFTAGYGAPSAVPALIRQYALSRLGFYYEHREAVVVGQAAAAVPFYRHSLESYRIRGVFQ